MLHGHLKCVTIFLFFGAVFCSDKEELNVSNQMCELSAQCGPHSFCDGVKLLCVCNQDYVVRKTGNSYECLKGALTITDDCTINSQCTLQLGEQSFCDPDTATCACNEGSHFDLQMVKCIESSAYGASCNFHRQCLLSDNTFASCINGKCQCPSDYFYASTKSCIKLKKLHEKCSHDESCENHFGRCDDGECTCSFDRAEAASGDVCLPAALHFGNPCKETNQCTKRLTGSVCINNECQCPKGKHGSTKICLNSVELGGQCTQSRECYINGLTKFAVECLNGICTCIGGPCRFTVCDPEYCDCDDDTEYHDVEAKKCVPQLKLGESCTDNLSCKFINGTCNKVCTCSNNHHSYESICYKNSDLNDACAIPEECFINGLQQKDVNCIDGKCYCIGGACREKSCLKGYCSCESGEYLTENNQCKKIAQIGESCQSNVNCKPFNGVCVAGTCQCQNTAVLSDNADPHLGGKICLPLVENLGGVCQQSSQCSIGLKNSNCLGGKCVCAIGYHVYAKGCYKDVQLGGTCSQNPECFVNGNNNEGYNCAKGTCQCTGGPCRFTSCLEGTCSCQGNEYRLNGKCVPISKIGEACKTNDNCSPFYASCDAGVCKCPTDTVLSDSAENKHGVVGKICLNAKYFNQACVQDSQCTIKLEGSKCLNKICSCPSYTHANGNKCYQNVALDNACTNKIECLINGLKEHEVDCRYGFCRCLGHSCRHISCHPNVCKCEANESIDNNKCVTRSHIGSSCSQNSNCEHFKGICVGGICQCPTSKILTESVVAEYGGKVCVDGGPKIEVFFPRSKSILL